MFESMMGPPTAITFHYWMDKNSWDFAVEVCPVEQGAYLFATEAYDVWSSFIDAHPECESDEVLKDYVFDRGPYGSYDDR